jgi:hypothetical protein
MGVFFTVVYKQQVSFLCVSVQTSQSNTKNTMYVLSVCNWYDWLIVYHIRSVIVSLFASSMVDRKFKSKTIKFVFAASPLIIH